MIDADRSDLAEDLNVIDSSNYRSQVFFRPSHLYRDRGQNAVPFIELQSVTTNPPSPLSGAALYHKGRPGYGGYIALELRTVNYEIYV